MVIYIFLARLIFLLYRCSILGYAVHISILPTITLPCKPIYSLSTLYTPLYAYILGMLYIYY